MILNADWRKLAEVIVEKRWGREDWLINIPDYCAKILTINRGMAGSYHYHKIKTESFLVLTGEVALVVGTSEPWAQVIVLKTGDRYHLAAGTPHLLLGLSKEIIQVLEISTHHSDEDVVRLWRPAADMLPKMSSSDIIQKLQEAGIVNGEGGNHATQ